jgi:hypothetical protein
MESHLIYIASSRMKGVAHWNEWIYCGVGDDIKEDVINKAINEYFHDSILYFVSDRKESSEMNKQNILKRIKKELGQDELFLWDVNFKKVIEFNKIGTMRSGLIPTSM